MTAAAALTDWSRCDPEVFILVLECQGLLNAADRASSNWSPHNPRSRRRGMTTPTCRCGNAARYVDQHGALVCGICPLKAGDDSIKLADVPRLLAWARQFLNVDSALDVGESIPPSMYGPMASRLRDIIQRRPT